MVVVIYSYATKDLESIEFKISQHYQQFFHNQALMINRLNFQTRFLAEHSHDGITLV